MCQGVCVCVRVCVGACMHACACVRVRTSVCLLLVLPLAPMCCAWTVWCRYVSALRTAAASAGKQMVGFERYLRLRSKGGNHTHINTLPISECLLGCDVSCCCLFMWNAMQQCRQAQPGGSCKPPSCGCRSCGLYMTV